MPIAIYLDKTGTTVMERFGLEPVMITILTLKAEIRNKTASAWAPLGFLPDLDNKSRNETKKVSQGSKLAKKWQRGMGCRNYHRCLDKILTPLMKLQETGMIIDLRFGPYQQTCHVYFPLF